MFETIRNRKLIMIIISRSFALFHFSLFYHLFDYTKLDYNHHIDFLQALNYADDAHANANLKSLTKVRDI